MINIFNKRDFVYQADIDGNNFSELYTVYKSYERIRTKNEKLIIGNYYYLQVISPKNPKPRLKFKLLDFNEETYEARFIDENNNERNIKTSGSLYNIYKEVYERSNIITDFFEIYKGSIKIKFAVNGQISKQISGLSTSD